MIDKSEAEALRSLDSVTDPDPRQEAFAVVDDEGCGFRVLDISDYHAGAESVTLSETVPEKVWIQFETAKNLYLYAWYVYRFLPVAEHHALACLEYALRDRYGTEISKEYVRKGCDPTLRPLLRYAIDKGDIRNEGFTAWHEKARVRSRTRHVMEKAQEMDTRGLDEIKVDEDEAEILDQDRDWDYVNVLKDSLPAIRNNYAHGSPTLHGGVLGTMEIVAECMNQIY